MGDERVEIAMMRTPTVTAARALPLSQAAHVADHRNAPVNALGLYASCSPWTTRRDAREARKRGAARGEVVQYKDAYRLCYIRGPAGLLLGLAQELSLGAGTSQRN